MTVPNGDAVLYLSGVRKTFEAENAPVRALRGVDFTMRPGEFAAVMGPSGCGKSTMLNLAAGLHEPGDALADQVVVVSEDAPESHASDGKRPRMSEADNDDGPALWGRRGGGPG